MSDNQAELDNILNIFDKALDADIKDPESLQWLQRYIQKEQDNVFKNITAQKDLKFEKVYGELTNSMTTEIDKNQHNVMSELNKNIYETQKQHSDLIIHDKDLSNRKYEMNEWTANNKRDTLFIFSMLFIMLSGLLFITGLWKLGLISTSIYVLLGIPMVIIFILTIVYRSQYTNVFRNKRYWNKKSFEGKYGKINIPMVCPGSMDAIADGVQSAYSSAGNTATALAASGTQSIASVAQSFATTAQNMANP